MSIILSSLPYICMYSITMQSRGLFLFISASRRLKKLSEESLTRPPEEVFDLLEKLGEG